LDIALAQCVATAQAGHFIERSRVALREGSIVPVECPASATAGRRQRPCDPFAPARGGTMPA